MAVERHLELVRVRMANADDVRHLQNLRDRADQLRNDPCGLQDGAVLACTGQVAVAERTAGGTGNVRTDRSFADELRTRWADSRDAEDRRVDIRGSRNVVKAFLDGAACAVACGGRAEAVDVLAVDDAAAEQSRWVEDRGNRDQRVAAELAVDRPMLDQGSVLWLWMRWKSEEPTTAEEDRLGEHESAAAELELPRELVPEDDPVFVPEQNRQPEELVLAEQQHHGTVLVELRQQMVPAVLESVLLVCSQRISLSRSLPVS